MVVEYGVNTASYLLKVLSVVSLLSVQNACQSVQHHLTMGDFSLQPP